MLVTVLRGAQQAAPSLVNSDVRIEDAHHPVMEDDEAEFRVPGRLPRHGTRCRHHPG